MTTRLAKKNLLVVNTGSIKKKFILQKLKKLGLNLVVLGREKPWANPYVDQWIPADTYSHTESVEAVRTYLSSRGALAIDGAVTFWEDDIPLLAKLCAEFKWIGNSPEAAVNTRNKFHMQEVLRACGEPYISQELIKNRQDLTAAMRRIKFPAVLKPLLGSDSQFVVYVSDRHEAEEGYEYLMKNCNPDYDPVYKYNKKLFLYQEFIEGHEFSLEGYVQHGVPHIVGVHEKTAMNLPFFLETGDYAPPRIDEGELAALTEAAKAALIVLKVQNSLAQVEIKLTKDGPKVIEAASRLGGDYTHKSIQEIYGVDLIKAGAEIALGLNVADQAKEPKKHIVAKYFIPKSSGLITQISGFDEIKKHPSVVDYFLAKEVGDTVLVPPEGFEDIGWVLIQGQSYAEAEAALAEVEERVHIEVAPFKSYSSLGKTSRKNRFSSALISSNPLTKANSRIERLRRLAKSDKRRLHLGIAANVYNGEAKSEESDLMNRALNIERTLRERGYRVSIFNFNRFPEVIDDLKNSDVDLVINMCERINGSSLLEPHGAAVFDMLRIPYTGSNPFTLSLCIDKIRVKKLLSYHNIPTPKWDYAYTMEDKISEDLRYPLIIKPANTDNSIGITNDSVVTNRRELQKQLERIIVEVGSPALVEEYIEGDEYDVSILGSERHDLQVLPLSRSIFKDLPEGYWHIFPYNAKWSLDPVYDNKVITQKPPKNIAKKLESLITEIALDTYTILDCHDYGRVELRVDADDNPYVLELNPNPSIDIGDCVPSVAQLVGMDYGDFLEAIIEMAIKRYRHRPPYYHLQTNLL